MSPIIRLITTPITPKNKDETGQFYGWHKDGGGYYEDGTERKLSLVCSLSCPTEYEDGELIVDNGAYVPEEERYTDAKEKMPKGSILVMTSDFLSTISFAIFSIFSNSSLDIGFI